MGRANAWLSTLLCLALWFHRSLPSLNKLTKFALDKPSLRVRWQTTILQTVLPGAHKTSGTMHWTEVLDPAIVACVKSTPRTRSMLPFAAEGCHLLFTMPSVLDQYVGCNECMAEITVHDAFDAAYASWPNQSWIAFNCKYCGCSNPLLVRKDSVTEGYLDGFPAPSLVSKRHISIPGLTVRCDATGIRMKSLNLSWIIHQRNRRLPQRPSQNHARTLTSRILFGYDAGNVRVNGD